jgi:acetate---CoA ligase (ADP-forming)
MSQPHRLDPLLAPRSIALVGASGKPDTPGNDMVRMARLTGYDGRLYPINPNYDAIEGLRCHPSLEMLPETVDHVVLSVANHRLEAALDEAIRHGAKAATIFASGVLVPDNDPPLAQRIAAKVRAAGMALCGGNCMGFYNLPARLRVAGFPSGSDMQPGGITFIAQSGSVFGALAHNDRRLRFNLVVSSGGEWVTTAADYLDWALTQETTRAVALFLESVRDPAGFVAGLATAVQRDIPVVVLKIGRTEAAAAMAVSHTGALAGSDAAHEALFRRYGVTRVATLDELAATLLLLTHPKRPAKGGLAAMHDSGGEREMTVDLASEVGVPYAEIGAPTQARLAQHLDPGLDPVNPLDAWGTGADYQNQFAACMTALLDDPASALGVLFADIRDDYYLATGYAAAMRRAAEQSAKPIAIATNYSLVHHERIALELTDAGIPVLDGTREALLAVRHALEYRDFRAQPPPGTLPTIAAAAHARWRKRLNEDAPFGEHTALDLLADYGITTVLRRHVVSRDAAIEAAETLGYPVALKTAAPDIAHKTEAGGVHLALRNEAAVAAAYDSIACRLGPAVLVECMATQGIEIAIGAINDPQFGPYVMVAAGGVLIELLADRALALAPIDVAAAHRLIAPLKVHRLLSGWRGAPPADIDALAECIARVSVIAAEHRDSIAEIDVNPVIVAPSGCIAVDALIVRIRQ